MKRSSRWRSPMKKVTEDVDDKVKSPMKNVVDEKRHWWEKEENNAKRETLLAWNDSHARARRKNYLTWTSKKSGTRGENDFKPRHKTRFWFLIQRSSFQNFREYPLWYWCTPISQGRCWVSDKAIIDTVGVILTWRCIQSDSVLFISFLIEILYAKLNKTRNFRREI